MKLVNLKNNQDGVVTIVVTVIVLVVISITTLGFAQLSRREERQALDRQLSSEANLAAESGINDAVSAIKAGSFTGPKSTCDFNNTISPARAYDPTGQIITLQNPYTTLFGGISGSSQYTCLLIDPGPTSLEYSAVTEDTAVRADVTLSGSGGIAKKIIIGWSGAKNFWPSGSPLNFPSKSNWAPTNATSYAPVLRVDLTDLTGGYSRNTMINSTYTGFLYPIAGGPTNRGGSPFNNSTIGVNRGEIVDGECNDSHVTTPPAVAVELPQDCNVIIDVSSFSSNHFLIRLKSIYDTSRVTIRVEGTGTDLMKISGGQTLIDSTGRATDVLRRQQVRISPQPPIFADFAVESADSICKRLFTNQNSTFVDPSVSSDLACVP